MLSGGPAKGIDRLVSKNLSDNSPPITVPYLHHKHDINLCYESMILSIVIPLLKDNIFPITSLTWHGSTPKVTQQNVVRHIKMWKSSH